MAFRSKVSPQATDGYWNQRHIGQNWNSDLLPPRTVQSATSSGSSSPILSLLVHDVKSNIFIEMNVKLNVFIEMKFKVEWKIS